jgi:hypothetical protein
MPSSLVALEIFFILLPGFAAAYVVQFLATRKSQSDLERVIEALLFSFVIYVCFVLLNRGHLPFQLVKSSSGGSETDAIVWQSGHIGILAAIAFAFALAAVAYIKWDGNRIFRWLHLTERTSRNSIWNDVLENEAGKDQVVQVELSDGRSVLGVLLYYSDAAEEGSVFVTQAMWVTSKGERIPIPGQGILLTKDSGIRSISLLDPGDDKSN